MESPRRLRASYELRVQVWAWTTLRGAGLALCVARFPLSTPASAPSPVFKVSGRVEEAGTELRILHGTGWVWGWL